MVLGLLIACVVSEGSLVEYSSAVCLVTEGSLVHYSSLNRCDGSVVHEIEIAGNYSDKCSSLIAAEM